MNLDPVGYAEKTIFGQNEHLAGLTTMMKHLCLARQEIHHAFPHNRAGKGVALDLIQQAMRTVVYEVLRHHRRSLVLALKRRGKQCFLFAEYPDGYFYISVAWLRGFNPQLYKEINAELRLPCQ